VPAHKYVMAGAGVVTLALVTVELRIVSAASHAVIAGSREIKKLLYVALELLVFVLICCCSPLF